MTIAVKNLAELDPELVRQQLEEVTQRVREENPSLDIRRGVIHDILLLFHAALAAGLVTNINDYLSARSLKAIEENPELADPELVDHVLSNFLVSRKPGAVASGEVAIVRSTNVSVTLAIGSVFVANGLRYLTEQVYTAKANSTQISDDSDRLITSLGGGRFIFTVPVVAEQTGANYVVTKDTLIVPEVPPSGYITSYAVNDFSGGKDPETNTELLARFRQGIACKAPSNRVNMQAMLREVEAFSRYKGLSIIGFGDAEMLRDKHWIFPVSGGGRMDWYLRSEELYTRSRLVKTATLVTKTEDARGVWQIAIGRDEAPGFYELANIRVNGDTDFQGGFAVVDDTRSLDMTGAGFHPDVETIIEGAYSRYQAAVIKFLDTETDTIDLAVGSRQDYEMEVRVMPLIAAVQDYINGRDIRSYGADALVRAPVPCFMQLNFTLHKGAGVADPDQSSLKNALAAAVNRVGFTGRLFAGALQDVIYAYLPDGVSCGAIDMFGRLRYPDGQTKYIRDSDILVVPDDPHLQVSAKTVQFFLAPEDIGITVRTTVPVPT